VPDLKAASRARIAALIEGASQWSDRRSAVREQARKAMQGGEWPLQVVERALDNVLYGADEVLRTIAQSPQTPPCDALAILPGNVIGPTIATAYCAAAAGTRLLLKSSSRELALAEIVAAQFATLRPELASGLSTMRWSGGDEDFEGKIFRSVRRIVAFGSDDTIGDIRRRAPAGVTVIGYGSSYSVGYVAAASDRTAAASAAALDVALFDQRGCLSPQTIYVEGDEAKAIVFAHALADQLASLAERLPRARAGENERAAAAEFLRRLRVRAMAPVTHALDTVLLGNELAGAPNYIVGVEDFGEPVCAGFGRIVIVKPATGIAEAARAISSLKHRLDTIGVAGVEAGREAAFAACGARRICTLGEMQRPPFGYRPRISDFRCEPAA
jgi:hypothetical protein